MDMIVVSSWKFRINQRYYLNKVAKGIELIITRKKDAFKVERVEKDDFLDRMIAEGHVQG